MSLAISYEWRLPSDVTPGVPEWLIRIAALARELKFPRVGEPRSFVGAACDPARHDPHGAELELLNRCTRIRLGPSGSRLRGATTTVPAEVHFVQVLAGAGCEEALLGFRRFDGEEGWDWKSHCVTQRAGAPEHGGEENFLASHVRLCELLRRLEREGLAVSVHDDTGHWGTRDLRQLSRALRAAQRVDLV